MTRYSVAEVFYYRCKIVALLATVRPRQCIESKHVPDVLKVLVIVLKEDIETVQLLQVEYPAVLSEFNGDCGLESKWEVCNS